MSRRKYEQKEMEKGDAEKEVAWKPGKEKPSWRGQHPVKWRGEERRAENKPAYGIRVVTSKARAGVRLRELREWE